MIERESILSAHSPIELEIMRDKFKKVELKENKDFGVASILRVKSESRPDQAKRVNISAVKRDNKACKNK